MSSSNVANNPLGFHALMLLAATALSLLTADTARAATYYVSPNGANSLSTSSSSPGSLTFALAGTGNGVGAAQNGDTVILENGKYNANSVDGAFFIYNSGVTFRAQNWHGATIENTAGANIWTSVSSSIDNITSQGIIFGPCASPTPLGYSGGADGGSRWQFLDCEFVKNDGFSFTANNLVYHCVFSDGWFNEFDSGGNNFTMRNSIVRRADRANGDIGDYVGNKVDGSDDDQVTGMVFDGVEFYDNKGSGLWMDTNLADWTIENCTFFAHHGGNFWFVYQPNIDTNIAATTTSYADYYNDISVGALLKADTGSNYGATTAIQSVTTATDPVSGATVNIYHLSTPLPNPPQPGDEFAEQAGAIAGGDGFITEANPNGAFINNVTYDNTDEGMFLHGSGDGYDTVTGGQLPTANGYYLTIAGNTFAYDYYGGIHFDGQGGRGGSTDNPGDPTRGLGPTTVNHNNFKFSTSGWSAWGAPLYGLPSYYGITFDYNDYDADSADDTWGFWWYPGTPTTAQSIAQMQSNFSDEQNGNSKPVDFTAASAITTAEWPAATDTNWSDLYYPVDPSSASLNSDYQVDDDETPYIQNSIAGKSAGQKVNLTVFGHTRVIPIGSVWQTDVFDYSGGYVTVTMNSATAIDSIVPPYAQLAPKTLPVTLNTTGSYGIMATYGTGSAPSAPVLTAATAGSAEVSLAWSITNATSYTLLRSLTNGSGYKTLATGLTATSYADKGLTNGTTYYYVVTATNTYGTSHDSNQLSATPEPYTGSLTGTDTTASTSTYNLTALGTVDWAHWNGTYNHKASGGAKISDITPVGGGQYGTYHATSRNVSWSDGTPVTSNSDDQNYVYCNDVANAGWSFTAPADTTSRTLNVLLSGATGATIEVNAHLSDDTARTVDDTSIVTIGSSSYLYTFTYAAASAGQTVVITLTNTASTAASVDLDAAWLTASTPPAAVSSITLNPVKVLGGHSSTGTVTLTGPAPKGGEVVVLSSSNTAIASVPASVTVPAGSKSATFHIGSTGVQATSSVTISGTAGSVTKSASLEVTFAIFRISFSPNDVPGGHTSTGTISLSAPAPSAMTIDFKTSNASTVPVPRAIVIAAGATQGTFKCYTVKPTVATTVSIEAYANNAGHLSEDLTVEP